MTQQPKEPRSWRTLREDLDDWREALAINDLAFHALLVILQKHQALRETTAA